MSSSNAFTARLAQSDRASDSYRGRAQLAYSCSGRDLKAALGNTPHRYTLSLRGLNPLAHATHTPDGSNTHSEPSRAHLASRLRSLSLCPVPRKLGTDTDTLCPQPLASSGRAHSPSIHALNIYPIPRKLGPGSVPQGPPSQPSPSAPGRKLETGVLWTGKFTKHTLCAFFPSAPGPSQARDRRT
ncbi:hypothetical protein JAAARDRAFT_56828 [Jaapia argillacea MUCL 33604]|uniref:Uncharacterized protein n=1 Tax=Jaapia argillacea MUCL 33604 TaxID=933084 RepID=A0A067Q8R7_9AGAM|nr:hypothetical protein JAAARDRAFT_56828 [Jaapia argillacea MUCL 33604]